MRALVTGGAGFIGSSLVRRLVHSGEHIVSTLDALTYAGNLEPQWTLQIRPLIDTSKPATTPAS